MVTKVFPDLNASKKIMRHVPETELERYWCKKPQFFCLSVSFAALLGYNCF
jgi:hypothetical protein